MYIALKHAHTLFSLLGLLATLAWLIVAWRGAASPDTDMSGNPSCATSSTAPWSAWQA